jgi:DeoR/GlpR family transcriptional regulator of sugar metabolism
MLSKKTKSNGQPELPAGMLASQRHQAILARLAEAGGARVTELAQALGVTEETVRRDLERLQHEGKLLRTHGGAVPASSLDLPFDVRHTANIEPKQRIARRALAHLGEGDVVALDASSTVFELAQIIPNMPLTVVTNSLPASGVLVGIPRVRVISTGGSLDPGSRSWLGSLAEHALDRLSVNKLFFSAKGLDLERGLSEVDDQQARIKRRMMELAQHRILLIDHSKFGARSVVLMARVDEVETIITDPAAPAEYVTRLRAAGLNVEVGS